MRSVARIASSITAIVLISCLLLLWLLPVPSIQRWLNSSHQNPSYIYRGPQAEDKAVVVAKIKGENVDWVFEELQDWQQAIYYMDDPVQGVLHPPRNKGREAMAYLTFLIDHYENLPSVIVFLHAHRQGWPEAWHVDEPNHDNVASIRSLRLEYVKEKGYANMRCLYNPGCPDEIQVNREENGTDRYTEKLMRTAWPELFGGMRSDIPEVIAQPCCGQFAVSKTQVLNRTKEEYVHYRQWLLDTTEVDYASGRVFEYLWHVIFGRDPVYCPNPHTCLHDQFDR